MPPVPDLPVFNGETPFQNFGDYPKERLIRDLQEQYAKVRDLTAIVEDLVTRMEAVETELGI